MEFVDGVREEELEARGIDVHRVVDAGMRCVCRMVFLHGFVHADLHPGNVRFLAPGRIVLLDLGLVGRLDDADRLSVRRAAVRARDRRRRHGRAHLLRQRAAHATSPTTPPTSARSSPSSTTSARAGSATCR